MATGEPTGVLEELPAYEPSLLAFLPHCPTVEGTDPGGGTAIPAKGVTTARHGFLADEPGILSDPALLPAFAQAIAGRSAHPYHRLAGHQIFQVTVRSSQGNGYG